MFSGTTTDFGHSSQSAKLTSMIKLAIPVFHKVRDKASSLNVEISSLTIFLSIYVKTHNK